MKCFDNNVTFTDYAQYMDKKLQHKRKPAEYATVATNGKRDKSVECIWENEKVRKATLEYLIKSQEYYRFCDECIGSAGDLFAASK